MVLLVAAPEAEKERLWQKTSVGGLEDRIGAGR